MSSVDAFHLPRFGAQRCSRILVLALLVALAATMPRPAAGEDDKDKPLPPEDVALRTSDGQTVAATYYPSKKGKQAAAVILLHAYGGDRGDFDRLARELQRAGIAVVAPDLRSHGAGVSLNRELHGEDFAAMVRRDLEAVKSFLLARNDAGELNVERLGVVGVEMGASLGLNWAALDWSWPPLATGKQGQDVKAVALISPEWSFKGIHIAEAVANPVIRTRLSFLIVAGSRNQKLLQEAKRLYNSLARYQASSPSDPIEKKTLFLRTPATTLQGMKLLNEKSLNVDQMIVEFVELHSVDPEFPWQKRGSR